MPNRAVSQNRVGDGVTPPPLTPPDMQAASGGSSGRLVEALPGHGLQAEVFPVDVARRCGIRARHRWLPAAGGRLMEARSWAREVSGTWISPRVGRSRSKVT
jgi:hypothetical protein